MLSVFILRLLFSCKKFSRTEIKANFFIAMYISQGGGGGYSGGDTYKSVMHGDGGTSYIGSKRSIADLSFIYAGDNIGHGSVVIVPALPHPACGCDYRCVVLDEFSVNVRCICPDGWRLKKDNQTACERKSNREI